MPTRNVNLTDYHDEFVNELVTSGRFSSASEVVRAGLRLPEQQAREEEEKLALLRSMAAEGFRALHRSPRIRLAGTHVPGIPTEFPRVPKPLLECNTWGET